MGGGLWLLATTCPVAAQDLQDRAPAPVAPAPLATPAADQVAFSADALDYDEGTDTVTATGNVLMNRAGNRLRADKVVWNRTSGKVVATGNIVATDPRGEHAYGDSIVLTDALKDGVVENMLIVLEKGGRLAAARGTRADDGTVELEHAVYSPCDVITADGCPKQPSWKITAVRLVYRPERKRLYFTGAQLHLFGLPSLPLPKLSSPIGGNSDSGLLSPNFRLSRVDGFEYIQPYYFNFGSNRELTVTPHIFTAVLPLLQLNYRSLSELGAYSITGYVTASRRSDDPTITSLTPADSQQALRGYLDGVFRYQLSPAWSVSGSLRYASDQTFLRRYEISYDDRLRNTLRVEHIDPNSYFAINGWYVQSLVVGANQRLQPFALPEIDYRRRITDPLLGGKIEVEVNSLAISRSAGQDTQRAFASVRWDLRRLTNLGQEVTLTAYGRGDLYNSQNNAASPVTYAGLPGFQQRAIGTLAADVKWPLIGSFLGGTQQLTPRVQIVASPQLANLSLPNEDSRSVDLEDSNLFALNRFAGYDRYEDSSRVTYGGEWLVTLPGFTADSVIGQSYRLSTRPSIFYPGTGLSGRFSDFVGRTDLHYRDFVTFSWRYRVDRSNFAVRRNEIDATVGSKQNYVTLGYLKLNRHILDVEDLQDRSEVRAGGRVQLTRFWSAFASTVIDLTSRASEPLANPSGYTPIRHRIGVEYEDNCIRLGLAWRRDYQTTGDARGGNSYLLTLALTNLGR